MLTDTVLFVLFVLSLVVFSLGSLVLLVREGLVALSDALYQPEPNPRRRAINGLKAIGVTLALLATGIVFDDDLSTGRDVPPTSDHGWRPPGQQTEVDVAPTLFADSESPEASPPGGAPFPESAFSSDGSQP